MNILPKKSWHVRTRDNIARVRRDEAAAAEEEKEVQRRAKLAEQEARVSILRARARQSQPHPQETKVEPDIQTATGHVNFFKEVEDGLRTGASTKKAEEKKEAEDFEKKAGILVQLGQNSVELAGGKNWYEDNSVSKAIRHDMSDDREIDLKLKQSVDPINQIMKHGGDCSSSQVPSQNVIRSASPCYFSEKKKKKSKHKKTKKRKRDRSYSPVRHKTKKRKRSPEIQSGPSLAELREKRLQREAKERIRTERLLAGKDPDGKDEPQKVEVIPQKYNSQFNPAHARQNYRR